MKFLPRLFRGPSRHEIDTCFKLCDVVSGRFVSEADHTARVRELIDANSRKVDEIRGLKREVEALERELMRAVRKAHENAGIVKSLDWVREQLPDGIPMMHVWEQISAFVLGFTGNPYGNGCMNAYRDGQRARSSQDATVEEATKAAGL